MFYCLRLWPEDDRCTVQALPVRLYGASRTALLAENVVHACCAAINLSYGLDQVVSHSLSSARMAALLQCCYGLRFPCESMCSADSVKHRVAKFAVEGHALGTVLIRSASSASAVPPSPKAHLSSRCMVQANICARSSCDK